MKKIMLTILFYAIDVVIFGSFIGLIFVFGYGLENIIYDKNNDLYKMFFVGVAYYWLIDSIASKFREEYKSVGRFLK